MPRRRRKTFASGFHPLNYNMPNRASGMKNVNRNPPGYQRAANKMAKHLASGNIDGVVKEAQKSVINGEFNHEKAWKAVRGAARDAVLKVGTDVVVKALTATASEALGADVTHALTQQNTTTVNPMSEAMGSVTHTHRTKIHTGRPTIGALWSAAKDNGISRRVILDTKISNPTDNQFMSRAQLDHSSGFNSRKFIMLPASTTITWGDLVTQTGVAASDTFADDRHTKAIASFLDCQSEFKIYNQNAHHKTFVKIYMLEQIDTSNAGSNPQTSFMNNVFSPQKDIQISSAIPGIFQHSDVVTETAGTSGVVNTQYTCDVSNKWKLTGSDYFKKNFKIAHTVQKTLEPKDIWLFKHVHHFGSGIDLQKLFTVPRVDTDGSNNEAASYMYAMEIWGEQVEGVHLVADTPENRYETYIGSGPASVVMEARKSLRFVNYPRNVNNVGAGFITSMVCHIRAWESDPLHLNADREFFKLHDDIASLSGLSVGKLYVPTLSSRLLTTQLTANQHSDITHTQTGEP